MVSYVAKGTNALGTTSCAPGYPAGLSANDLILCAVQAREAASAVATMPAGWTLLAEVAGTFGTVGVDTGPTRMWWFTKDTVSGSESGTVTVTVTSGTVCIAAMFAFQSATGAFDIAWASGEDTSAGTTISAVCSPDGGLGAGWIAAGDFLFGHIGKPTDAGTCSAQNFASTGLTIGARTEVWEYSSTNGNDLESTAYWADVSSGTQSVSTVTASASVGTSTYGPALVLRLRDAAAGDVTFTTLVGDATADGGSTAFTADATFTTSTGAATADGAVTSFTADAVFATTAADATADGSTASFTADAVFATSEGAATADGGTSSFTTSSGVTFATLPGEATADGGTGTFRADATFATTAGGATADGTVTTFTAAATFTTTAAEATADGGQAAFTASATFTTTEGAATADGGTGTFTGAALFTTTVGDATADGGEGTFRADGLFASLVGVALADGGTGTFTIAPTLARVPKVVETVGGAEQSRTIRPGPAPSATLAADPGAAILWAHTAHETLSGVPAPRRTL